MAAVGNQGEHPDFVIGLMLGFQPTMVLAFAADAAPLAAQVDVAELLDGADNSQ